jgi:phage repressor protein C with HTH and peptisase S24 domain
MFKNNFIKFCNQKGESPTAVCRKIGLSNATFTCWTDESVPRRATLQKIADYFDITVEELLREDEPPRRVPDDKLFVLERQNVHMIPLYENAAAGFGALAIDNVVDYIPLYISSPSEAAETICIRVRGDSMYPTIDNGDIIQVHKQTSVDSGSVAVVLVDGDEALVKKVVYGKDWIELHSFNPMYKTMRFNGPDVLRIRVVGLVKKVTKEI